MKTTFIAFASVLGILALSCSKSNSSGNNNNNDNIYTPSDSVFAARFSQGNFAEIDAGTLASTHADHDTVKMFGAMMVTDHTAAQHALDSIAGILQLALPDGADSLHHVLYDSLAGMNEDVFDSTYIAWQIADHQAALVLLNAEIAAGVNPRLITYASNTKPVVEMHLKMADSIKVFLAK